MNNYKITTLDNGIRVITENIPYVQSFSLGFWLNVGSRDETVKNNGISHFIEHMFFKGTKKRSARRISEEIESLGGYLNAFTSKEHTCFYGRGLTHNIEKTFSVLSDMIQNPLFRQGDIKKEANVVIDELYDIEDSPEEIIFDNFESKLYKKNPLSYPIIGTESNIKNFTQDDLFEFINSKYCSNKIFVVASGNVDHNKIVKLAEKYISKKFELSRAKRKYAKTSAQVELNVKKEIQQSHVIIGSSTAGYKDDKRSAVSVLSSILGDGSSSRLFHALREKRGITYQINSFLNSYYDISTFGIYFSTNDKSLNKAEATVMAELEKLKNKKVTEKELKKAKEYIKGSIIMGLENTTNRMIRMAQSYIYFNKIKTVEESIEKIENVTSDEILSAANELFDNSKLGKIVISSKN